MSHRVRFMLLIVVVCAALRTVPAQADVRATKVTADVPFRDRLNSCFSGRTCRVGIRGAWLDLTNRVTVSGNSGATATIKSTGVDDASSYVPPGQGREGFVDVEVTNIGSGDITLRLHRPAPGGTDSDTVAVNVRKGNYIAHFDSGSHISLINAANQNEPKVFDLLGHGLTLLKVLHPENGDEVLSRTSSTAKVRLTFSQRGTASLKDKVGFIVARPELNDANYWPSVNVYDPGTIGSNQGSSGGAPPPPPRPTTGTSSTLPNLTPSVIFPSRPLLRKINNLQSVMLNSAFCSGLANNEEREVAVPDFEWAVSSGGGSDINTAFSSVVTTTGAGNALSTERVDTLRQNDIRTFKNWSGRPARIRVVKVTGPPLLAEYQNSAGCYLPNALSSGVALDPRPIIIRVDSGLQIPESVEIDNELQIN